MFETEKKQIKYNLVQMGSQSVKIVTHVVDECMSCAKTPAMLRHPLNAETTCETELRQTLQTQSPPGFQPGLERLVR